MPVRPRKTTRIDFAKRMIVTALKNVVSTPMQRVESKAKKASHARLPSSQKTASRKKHAKLAVTAKYRLDTLKKIVRRGAIIRFPQDGENYIQVQRKKAA